MLITLMFLVVAKKSRTFSSFSNSANEQVCRSREGAQPGSQPKLASRNMPYHGCCGQYINGRWAGGQEYNLFFPRSLNFSVSLVFFGEFCKIHKICYFHDRCSGTGYTTGSQAVRKIVLCVTCFAYLLLVVVILLVFTLLSSYYLVFISTHEFYFFFILLHTPLGRSA